MYNLQNQPAVKTGDWFLTFFIVSIPVIGFILLFVWAFGSSTNESKANWAKAALIWYAITTVISIFVALAFGAAIFAAFN